MKLNFRRFVAILLVAMMTLTALPTAGIAEVMQDVSRESGSIRMLMVEPDNETYYTYEFYDEDSTTPFASQIVKNGDTLLEPAAPAKANKKFERWEPPVPFGLVSELTDENKTIQVTAKYTEVYYVFFKDNTGRVVKTKEAADGDKVTTADVQFPVETDHAITGWYTDEEFNNPVTMVTIDKANVTLYAKVEAGHWLTFDSDGGSYVAPVFVPNGKTAAKPDDPTRPGYTFAGWGEFDFTKELTEDATAKAKWTVDTHTQYTVIHWQENADDNEYSYVESETKYGETAATTAAAAKRYNGFTAQTIEQQTIAGDGSTIVNVYYKRNVYFVKFYDRWGSSEYTQHRITAKYGANIRNKWPGGTWKVSANGSVSQANIDVMPIGGFKFFETKQGDGKAYYYLADLNGNYVLDHTDTGASSSAFVTKEDRYDITGFVCNKQLSAVNGAWYNGAKFYYDRAEYKVVYINSGNTVNTESYKYQQDISKAGDYNLPNTAAPEGKEGYIFDGWAADADGTKPYNFTGKTMPAQNITVYAKWKAPTYTVKFFDHKGVQYGEVAKVDKGHMVAEPKYTVSLSGDERFLGWALKDGTPFNFGTEINEDYELYAKVASTAAYSVIYNANGGFGNVPVDDQKYAEGALADVKPADRLTPPQGKIFLGWSTNPKATTAEVYPYGKLTIGTADVTLYAIWGVQENTVAITYKGNGGVLTDGQKEYTISNLPNNDKITVEKNTFAKAGYKFVSWNTKADGTGISFDPGAKARVNSEGEGENVLYAIWEAAEQEYTIHHYLKDTEIRVAKDQTGTMQIGTTLTAAAAPEKDLIIKDVKAEEPFGSITIDADPAKNVIIVYYTKDVTFTGQSDTLTYTGEEQELTGIEVKGLRTGDAWTGLSYSAKGTNVGDYPGVFTGEPIFTDAEGKKVYYYNVIGKVPGNLKITPIATKITITAASDSKKYDGTPLTNAGYTYTPNVLLEGDELTAVVEGSATNVGDEGKNVVKSYKVMRGNVDVTDNYTFTDSVDGKLTVTPVEIELTAASDSKTYDGTPLTNGNYTITNGSFVGEEGLAGVTVEGSQTTVGSSANTITGHTLKENTLAKNYHITYQPGTLEVTQNTETIIITANSHTWEYDGQPHTDGGYTVNYEGKDYTAAADGSVVLPTGDTLTATVEGTVTNVADSADNNNVVTAVTIVNGNGDSVNNQYATITRIPGGLKITPRGAGEQKVLLTAADNTVVYDGQVHGAKLNAEGNIEVNTSYTITYLVEGHSVQTVAIAGSKTNVGKYPSELVPSGAIIVDGDGNDVTVNYLVTYEKGDLEIVSPETVIVKIRGNQSKVTYDAKQHEVNGYTVESISNPAYTEADFGMVEGASAHAEGTNVGKYNMNLTAESFKNRNDNFESVQFVVTDGWLDITPITDEVTVNITGNTGTEVYNGKEHAVTGYTTDVGDKTITVALKEGKAAEAKGTNANTYPMGLTEADFTVTSDNYSNIKVVVNDGSLEITPVTEKVTVTIKGHKGTFKYDGMEHTVTGYDVTDISNALYTENDFTFSGTAKVKEKNARELPYLMELDASQFANVSGNFSNVEFAVTDGEMTINPRNITIRANNNTVEYDGNPHGKNGYTLEGDGLAEGEKILGLVIDGEQTEADFYPGELKPHDALIGAEGSEIYPDNYNYNIEYANGDLEITPVAAEVVVTITEHGGKAKYDGTEHVVTGYDVTSISNRLYTEGNFTFNGKAEVKGIDAGSYPMLLKSADFVNTSKNFDKVTFVIVDATLEIEKREVILTSASDEKVYDGKALTNDEVTVSGDGFAEDEGAYCGVTGRQLNVGESDNEFTYELLRDTKAGNYKITKEYGTLKVTPVTEEVVVTITGHKGSAKYDGSEKTVTGYDVTGISNPLYTENDFTFSGDATASGIHAGKYPMGLKTEDFKNTSENFANVKFMVEDGEMEIQKIALTITSESYEGDYDAQWHQVGYTAEGLAATDAITALEMKNHRILKPGEMVSEFVANTLKITHADGSDATGDYEVTFVPGKLTVNTVIVNYRVFYYYDGVLDESEIEEGTGEVLTQITEYKDKPKDMQFDHVTGFPLTLGLDEMKNIIRVYYVHTPLTGNLGAANIGDCIE